MKCSNAGTHVRLSSDGVLLSRVDYLIECGISMQDPQVRANGLDRVVDAYRAYKHTEHISIQSI